jgi:hypothetical protein
MSFKARNVGLTLLGVAGLLACGRYEGPWRVLVHSYGGNLSVSFAMYFILLQLPAPARHLRSLAAGLALLCVTLFEAFDGFGITLNTYDPFDYPANAAGIALALLVDLLLGRITWPAAPAPH